MIHGLVLFCLCFFPLIGAETDEIVSAMEGGSFTLRPGFTEIQRDHELEWRFGSSRTRISKIEAGNIFTDDITIFRDRLLIERQTGDLTITNIKTTDAGDYEVSNSINTFKKTLTVNVRSGPSSGAAAGIASAVVLLVAAAAAVIATR